MVTPLHRSARAGAFLLVAIAAAGCGGSPSGRTSARPAPAGSQPAEGTLQVPTKDLLRVDAATGGGVDVMLHRIDSTLSLALRVPPDTGPRPATRVRVMWEPARWWVDSATRLIERPMAGGEARLRITGRANEPPMELVRVAHDDSTSEFWIRSVNDDVVLALRRDEARGVVRMVRLAATALAPTTDEERLSSTVYFEFQVEKPVVPLPHGCFPRYPVALRESGVTGSVVVQFVVGTEGRAERESFRVLRGTHPGFAEAVREALPCFRFSAAELHGRPVRQLVQQPFSFDIQRDRLP